MEVVNSLITEVEAYVTDFIAEKVSSKYAYHNLRHTLDVVAASKELGAAHQLHSKEMELLLLAAWFHDVGYDQGPSGHEERSGNQAKEFLKNHNFEPSDIETIQKIIMATKMPQTPKTKLEKVLCDADMSHLGKKIYWERCGRIRQELALTINTTMSEPEWIDFELKFITNHSYHTDIAKSLYTNRKRKHIRQLKKLNNRLHPEDEKLKKKRATA